MSSWTPIHWLLVLIPTLPLLSAVVTAVLGARVLRRRSHWPTVVALAVACVLSGLLLVAVWQASRAAGDLEAGGAVGWSTQVDLWTWADIRDARAGAGAGIPPGVSFPFTIAVTLQADPLTAIMLAMVTFVSLLVAIYSVGYMAGDRGYWRFFSYVSLFVFAMTMLVSVSNFVLLYVFWEAVGLCSYLLIGFWYEKPAAAAAGKKAFLVNRVGDFGFALALFLIWMTYGTMNFQDTPAAAGVLGQTRLADPSQYVGGGVGLAICLLLMLGACGKSAQLPLHVWLPDAMEGPTPVSALIHAATMVTAGVYMVTRCTPLFMVSPGAQLVVALVGGLTALVAALIALTQNDLKRILAYSTISQLGYMFLGLGTGLLAGVTAGMFHLLTHAFFKGLLFLGAGSVMHAMGGVIDIRRFGGLRRRMPQTHWTFLCGALALVGFPLVSGFFSKDAIMASVHTKAAHAGHFAGAYEVLFWGSVATAFLTAVYTFRAYFLTFFGAEQLPAEAADHGHESPRWMTGPMWLLAVFALGAGWAFQHGVPRLLGACPSLRGIGAVAAAHAAPHGGDHTLVVALSVMAVLAGMALAAFLYGGPSGRAAWLGRRLGPLYRLSYDKFFFDPIYRVLVVWPGLGLAALSDWIDNALVDGLVNLTGRMPGGAGALLRRLQTGLVPWYAVLTVLGLLALAGSIWL